MYSHEHKFIYVHIPKTGGSSIEHILNPNVSLDSDPRARDFGNTKFKTKHWTIKEYKNSIHPDNFKKYFKFAFVRNPWDLHASLYSWLKALGNDITFKEHIHNQFNSNTMGFDHFICDEDGEELVDFIGKFETLQKDFDIICDKIGFPKKSLPHINKVKRPHYSEYYDNDTCNIVAEKYAKEIKKFNYTF